MNEQKHIVCHSGGHSSAIVAIEVVRKFGKENVILLNHDISTTTEDEDIKRFKKEVADYLGLPITYANINGIDNPNDLPDQFDVCMTAGAMTDSSGHALCTAKLKTEPFYDYLAANHLQYNTLFGSENSPIIYYGFDMSETVRVNRRYAVLGSMGYRTDFPLARWVERTIYSTKEIGIEPPNTYSVWKHANCKGCLKASLLHWYVTYVHAIIQYEKAVLLEMKVNFTVHTVIRNGIKIAVSLDELRPIFKQLHCEGFPATEHQSEIKFANKLRQYGLQEESNVKPCECIT